MFPLCDRADSGHRRATQRGDQMLKLGKLDIAEACYLGALKHKNDFPMALYGLGEVHTQAEDRDDLAEAAYRLAIENWPEYVDAYIALGDLHERRERNADAVASYEKALEVAPGDVMAWEAIGRHYLATSDFDKAADSYKLAVTKATNGETSPWPHRRPRQGCLGPRHATRRRGEHQEVRRVRVARGEVTGTRAGLWPSRALEREVPHAPQADEEGDRAPGTGGRPGAGAAGAPLVPRG
jgi:tetratricopeptide (TPR) repeat protein